MIRLFHTLLAVFLVPGVALSCTDPEQEQEENQNGPRTFTCTIASFSGTKASVEGDGTAKWQPGDEILVHGEYSEDQAVVALKASDISADGQTATIRIEGVKPYIAPDGTKSSLYAAFPASAVENASRCLTYQRFTKTNNFLMAAFDDGDKFVFHNLTAAIRFSVSGDFDGYTFSSNGSDPVGYDSYQVSLTSKALNYKYKVSGEKTTLSGNLVSGGATVYFPDGAELNGGYTISLLKGGAVVKVYKKTSSVWLDRGSLLDLGDISASLTDPSSSTDPGHEDPPAGEDTERLARIGQTPIIGTYFTEYTPSSQFPTLEDVRCFTHIFAGHARFVNPKTGDGGLEIKNPGPNYLERLSAYKADYPELKIQLFIGGWGKNADGFSEMAKDPAKRALFCSECVRLCNKYNLDGVDIDWEYPTYAAKTYLDNGDIYYNGASPEDRANFSILMKELRAALGKDKIISYAASSDDYDAKYIDSKEVLQWVDFINLMTYSMGDPYPQDPKQQRHNSPLYTSPNFNNSRGGADVVERYHDRQGIPFNRMNYGVGFYGHGASPYPSSVSYAMAREALEKGTVNGKSVTGYNIRHWDEPSKSCYLGNAAGVMYASYEDVESIGYRVAYVKEKGMLGAFDWEYREDDADGTLRKAFHALMREGLPENPGNQNPPDPSSAEDLGGSETANCYMVNQAGTYKFKAVKGNSSSSVGSVASAEVLWQTATGMISGVGVSGGYITFSTPSTLVYGNALIAAKDASGKVLWSWHIWIPKTAVSDNMYGLSYYKMMSRNLGALEDASSAAGSDSYGLLYQWGRKDPFPCQAPSSKKSGKMTLSESIEKPSTFAVNDGTWMSSVDKTVWGDKATKTIYDPCPAGYKVPMREDVTSVFANDNLVGSTGWQYSSGHAFAIGSPQVWFPYSGYIDVSGKYVSDGSDTKIWNSHMDTANDQGYGIFVSGSSSTRSSQPAAQGGSIRCISVDQVSFTNEAGMPEMGSYTRIDFGSSSTVVELSGLHLSSDKTFLWGVGDEGYLYKFTNIDGDVSGITPAVQWSHEADMEGVTLDPDTGDLYLAIEPKKVYRIPAPNHNTYSTVIEVEEAASLGNSGMEGIAWHKGDLYLGAQSGATLWKYKKSGSSWVKDWKKQLGQIAPGIQEVGDLFYDAKTDLLWVSDSEAFKIFVFDGDVTKLKAIYDIKFIGNPESLCVDHDRNCVWMADDGSTSKIYKISFSGL